MTDVSIVVPAYNRPDLLLRCLRSLAASEGASWEATVVDNASPEDLSAVRAEHPVVRWLRMERNVGYAAANNAGLREARGRHVCYLNSDAELFPETLAGLVDYLDSNPRVGAVTPRNIGPDGNPQPICSPEHTLLMAWLRDSGFHLLAPWSRPFRSWLLPRFDYECAQEVATTQTTCLLIRGDAYRGVGQMDASLFLFYNDVDYCRRLREAGWSIIYLPEPRVLHHGSASVDTALWKERQLWMDRYRFFRKWYGRRGTAGVRFACWNRAVTRALAQVARGRWKQLGPVWKVGRELCDGLSSQENGA